MSQRRVCVYCGANPGKSTTIVTAATALGTQLAARGIGVVYGGTRIGLMGAIANATLAAGGSVIGVLPEVLTLREPAHPALEKRLPGEPLPEAPRVWIATRDMSERKAVMAQHSDCFLVLPGGYGTLDELFEMLTWTQIGVQNKRSCLLNLDGYYDHLIAFLDRAVADGLLLVDNRALLDVVTTVEEAVEWSATVGAGRGRTPSGARLPNGEPASRAEIEHQGAYVCLEIFVGPAKKGGEGRWPE